MDETQARTLLRLWKINQPTPEQIHRAYLRARREQERGSQQDFRDAAQVMYAKYGMPGGLAWDISDSTLAGSAPKPQLRPRAGGGKPPHRHWRGKLAAALVSLLIVVGVTVGLVALQGKGDYCQASADVLADYRQVVSGLSSSDAYSDTAASAMTKMSADAGRVESLAPPADLWSAASHLSDATQKAGADYIAGNTMSDVGSFTSALTAFKSAVDQHCPAS